ncbi:hypothetical protein Focb16_v013966 [Fusarium oxysporum f. sp. cubense]|uniref:Uncharacterized protein n=1 Tax=Fusarium oxysporum f. sp. cubense TaxID=61366 RepID=A0A559KRG4_FUSOC|nr:hypothetical protein Focb16_v013966 [Fusarium oxysporum f. sp. cubense]
MAAINFASTACSAGNRGQLVDAVSQWQCVCDQNPGTTTVRNGTNIYSAIATAAGSLSQPTLLVPIAEPIVARAAPTLKMRDGRLSSSLTLKSYLSLFADWFSLY